jgi:hypothetical protein
MAARMLSLRQPSWTSDGEILNLDRHVAQRGPGRDDCAKFTTHARDPALFAQVTAFLDATASRQGFAYKDVVQPFAVAGWSGLCDFRVLYVHRDPAEVAYSMLRRRWYYPAAAVDPVQGPRRRGRRRATDGLTISEAVVRGLVLAERALEQVPAARIEFDQLLPGPDGLAAVLRKLYPDVEQQPVGAEARPNPVLGRARQQLIRRSPEFCALTKLVSGCREALP